jgi:putative heavy-metal-binding protein
LRASIAGVRVDEEQMQISQSREIKGRRILCSIGRIEAASAWHVPGNDEGGVDWKARALDKLVLAAKEFEADAIVEVDFAVDDLKADHLSGRLERVCAKGVAVRLARS